MAKPRNTKQPHRPDHSIRLDVGVVGDRSDGLGSGGLDDVSLTGTDGLALKVEVDTLLLGLLLLLGVLLDTLDEVLTGTGVLDVLDADVDALLEVAVADNLVEEDTDGGLGDVVDNTGLTVVDLVGHTIPVSANDPTQFKGKSQIRINTDLSLFNGRNKLTPSERHR